MPPMFRHDFADQKPRGFAFLVFPTLKEFNDFVFDQKYFHDQRQLVLDAYSAIRLLRLVLANHPHVSRADIEIEEHLKQGLIWSF